MQPALTVPATQKQSGETRRRKRIPFGVLFAGIAIMGAIIYLVYANTQANAVYYMTVPELQHCTTCTTQSVRVAGFVKAGSIVRHSNDTITFTISDTVGSTPILPVTYSGVVPDIFRSGVQVVVEGHYTGSGPFQAQTLLAKCPSKFQSATPAAQ